MCWDPKPAKGMAGDSRATLGNNNSTTHDPSLPTAAGELHPPISMRSEAVGSARGRLQGLNCFYHCLTVPMSRREKKGVLERERKQECERATG